ncbi:MAG: hypothetical protein NTY19_03785 [Planctomycetota bacterium]|nr:hypothetical protein [Planctomycetota bacterium]
METTIDTQRTTLPVPPVEIHVHNGYALVGPAHADLVRPILETVVPVSSRGGPRGYRIEFVCERHYKRTRRGGMWVMAGLVPRIAAYLEQLGYQVRVVDEMYRPAHRDVAEGMFHDPRLSHEDSPLLRALVDSRQGLIVVREPGEVPPVVAMVCGLYPKAHTVIVAANRKMLKKLIKGLRRYLDGPVTSEIETLWSMDVRTYLCTAYTFGDCFAHDWDLVVFTDVESALAKRSQHTLARMPGMPRYALLPAGQVLGPVTSLRLEELCGGVIFRQARAEQPLAGVSVLLGCVRGVWPLSRRPDLDERRRVWRDLVRNRSTVRLAQGIANGDESVLQLLRAHLPSLPTAPTVSILAASTEQGRNLLTGLPRWKLAHEVPVADTVGSRRTSRAAANDRTLATLIYAQRQRVVSDVVIRADGAELWPLSAAAFPRDARRVGDSVLVVDVVGDISTSDQDQAAASVRRRVAGYEKLGWHVHGILEIPWDGGEPDAPEADTSPQDQ